MAGVRTILLSVVAAHFAIAPCFFSSVFDMLAHVTISAVSAEILLFFLFVVSHRQGQEEIAGTKTRNVMDELTIPIPSQHDRS